MRLLALMLLLATTACAAHECEMDKDCPQPDGGCEVPALHCTGPYEAACREHHCEAICSCNVKKP
jgi:hypothetical protein